MRTPEPDHIDKASRASLAADIVVAEAAIEIEALRRDLTKSGSSGGSRTTINMKKRRGMYSELGLQLRNEHPKRWVKAKLRDNRQIATGPNDVWAMDFVHGQLATGRNCAS